LLKKLNLLDVRYFAMKNAQQTTDHCALFRSIKISDHQQSWGYEDGPWKGPEPPLLVAR
jgi:hypothetical protein